MGWLFKLALGCRVRFLGDKGCLKGFCGCVWTGVVMGRLGCGGDLQCGFVFFACTDANDALNGQNENFAIANFA